jgi:class 3 adenylate cyclase
MAGAIHRHGGTLDKFIGDGIMAFFGAPNNSGDPCGDAFRSAQEMIVEVGIFNAEQEARGGPAIAIGVGLYFGPALVGYIGASERHEYSAIGDTVNAASRLESMTKDVGYPIVMSDTVRQQLADVAGIHSLGAQPVKGRAPIIVFGWKP